MTCLPDVNLWLAMAVARHIHHSAARAWLDRQEYDRIVFCRVTEMGLLRLLTNTHVMQDGVLSPARAWAVRDAFLEDDRVSFAEEPAGFSGRWREIAAARKAGTNFWTDAYLAAFCRASGYTLVTFDRGLKHHKGGPVELLIP